MKTYILTTGEYDDYRVLGAYKAESPLTEDDFRNHTIAMIAEQFPELEAATIERAVDANDYYFRDMIIAEMIIGRHSAPANGWFAKKEKLFADKDLDVTRYMEKKGVIKWLETEEIRLEEAWTSRPL